MCSVSKTGRGGGAGLQLNATEFIFAPGEKSKGWVICSLRVLEPFVENDLAEAT